ncbi:MAG: TonB-dependent receptor, partial [Pseudomonadota bacterium]
DQGLDPNLVISRTFNSGGVIDPWGNERETFRIVGGLRGDVSEAFSYEVSVNYGRTETSNISQQWPVDRYVAASDVISDPDTGEPICRSDIDPDTAAPLPSFPTAVAPGFRSFAPGDGSCVPVNPFAPITEAQADFLFIPSANEFAVDQLVINATATGSSEAFFELPAGAIGYAVGFEYREETSLFQPSELVVARLNTFAPFSDPSTVAGGFDVFEGFAEVNFPVLKDVAFAKSLDIDASLRVADYSSVGTATSFAFGAVWQPVEDLRVRASYNRAIRAPNLSELFTPQNTGPEFITAEAEPCLEENLGRGTEFRAANCAALVGADFDPDRTFFDAVNAISTSGGNPNLSEETAQTFTIGLVYTPQAVSGLSVIVDYYNIDIEEAIIQGFSREALTNTCVDAPTIDNAACAAITRNPTTGLIESINTTALNLGASRTSGIDYQIAYEFDLDNTFNASIGDFTATLAGTFLLKREDQVFADLPDVVNNLRGDIGNFGAFPRHFINAALNWQKDKWSADYGFTFQSSTTVTSFGGGFGSQALDENPQLLNNATTGSGFVHYLGGAYRIDERFQLSLRVNNLFDRDPFQRPNFNYVFRPVSALGRTVQFGIQGTF